MSFPSLCAVVVLALAPGFALAEAPGAVSPEGAEADPAHISGAVAPALPSVAEADGPTADVAAEPAPSQEKAPRFGKVKVADVELGGFLRVGFSFLKGDPVVDYIGHSNGFEFAAARLDLAVRPFAGALAFVSLDAALGVATEQTGVAGERRVAARDVLIEYEAFPALVARVGQFKAPFLSETLACDADALFLHRSIVESGVAPPFGYAADGLGLGRQLGASVSSRRLDFSGFGLRYEIGVFNGNGENALFNDDGSFMPAGRIELDYASWIRLGAAIAYSDRTEGERPDLMKSSDLSYTVDLAFQMRGLKIEGAYVQRNRDFETGTPVQDGDRARGVLAQVSWRHAGTGLEPAYRYAFLEPSRLASETKVTHHTVGLNWKPSWIPLRLYAAYTFRMESLEDGLTNDGFELGAQLGFF